jgi:multisubunit Na+/H+ antiporter MnhC subunit
MTITIPDVVILTAIVSFAATGAVALWRINELEKVLRNGIVKKIERLYVRVESIEKKCIAHHSDTSK